jgi:hypothetical protein
MFENGVLRGLFGEKKEEITGVWRKEHAQDLHNMHSSPGIFRMLKSSRMI